MRLLHTDGIRTTDGGLLTIPFNTPYTYNGGNLLIGIENTTDADCTGVDFYGQSASGASVAGADAESLANVKASRQNFIPKTTFEYTARSGVAYPKPKGLAASEVTTETATLSWTAPEGDVTGYVYQYKKASEETWSTEATVTTTTVTISGLTAATVYHFRVKALYGSNESGFASTNFNSSGWLQYDDGAKKGEMGSNSLIPRTWGVMYPAVTGNRLTKVSFYENPEVGNNHITISIYSGNETPSGTPLRTVEVSPMGSIGFHEVTFDTPVEITPKENIWIVLTITGKYVMSYCDSTEPNNQWIFDEGSWKHIGDLNASLASRGWMIRGYFESTTDEESVGWTEDTATSSSYPITGLTPETDYYVQVRGDYGSNGKSEWVTSLFTTPADNVPIIRLGDLNGDGILSVSDVTTLVNIILGDNSDIDVVANGADGLTFDGLGR